MKSIIQQHKPFVILLLLVFITHSIIALVPPLMSDEAMFWEWSRHLAFGYYAHPPMTAWLIAFMIKVFGTLQYTVRLTAIINKIITLVFVYLMTKEIAQKKSTAFTAALIYSIIPISFVLGAAITTDSPLIMFFTAATYYVRRAIIEDNKKAWYFAAIACGGMMLSKFMAALFFPGVFLFLLLKPLYREWLRKKEPYLAFLISLLIFSPFLVWNSQNKWLTFQFNLVVRHEAEKFNPLKPLMYIGGQVFSASPVLLVVLIVVLFIFIKSLLFRSKEGIKQKNSSKDSILLLAFIVAVPFLIYLPVSIFAILGAHYTGIVYPTASVLLAIWFFSDSKLHITDGILRKKSYWASLISAGAFTLTLYVLFLFPKMLPDNLVYIEEKDKNPSLVSHAIGWEIAGPYFADIIEDLEKRPEGFFLSSFDYGLASLLGFYIPGHPQCYLMSLPKTSLHGRTYLLWEQGKKKIGANTLFIADTAEIYKKRLTGFFKRVEPLEPLYIKDEQGRVLRRFYLAIGWHYLGGEPNNLSIW